MRSINAKKWGPIAVGSAFVMIVLLMSGQFDIYKSKMLTIGIHGIGFLAYQYSKHDFSLVLTRFLYICMLIAGLELMTLFSIFSLS